MDRRDDIIEEFFRKSLDKFNDEPTDALWDNLNDKLGQDRSSYYFLKRLKYILPLVLLLTGFAFLYLNQAKSLSDSQYQLSLLQTQNEKLSTEIENLKSENSSTLSNNVESANPNQDQIASSTFNSQIKTSEVNNASSVTSFNERIKTKYIYLRDTIYLNRNVYISDKSGLNSLSGNFARRSGVMSQNPSSSNSSSSRSLGGGGSSVSDGNILGSKTASGTTSALANNYFGNSVLRLSNLKLIPLTFADSRFDNETISSWLDQFPPISFVASEENQSDAKKRKKKKRKRGRRIRNVPIVVNKLDPWGKPHFYYRVGPSAFALMTFRGNISAEESLGYGFGLTQEIGLTTRFAIRSGVYLTDQEYALGDNSTNLSDDQITEFPNQSVFGSEFRKIDIGNKLIEFPLGIKYDFYQDNIRSIFAGVGMKWSILRSQEYKFYQPDNRLVEFKSERRFGYLNAMEFSIGIENSINSYMDYQFMLAYDLSVEPIGVERNNLSSLRLGFNLLFGRK